MKEYTYTEKKDTRSGFGDGLTELGRENKDVVALCADLTGSLKMNDFRRFVAGAICPNCKKKDTIALSADDKRIFCVSCDFEEYKSE